VPLALAGVAACRRPVDHIVPWGRAPEQAIPGVPSLYATTVSTPGSALGLLVESHDGRPTKVEGNPDHPESLGGTHARAQALVWSLYDPDRPVAPTQQGRPCTLADARGALRTRVQALEAAGGQGLWVVVAPHRSPTLATSLRSLRERMPLARVVRHDAFPRDNVVLGTTRAWGRPLEPVHHPRAARVVVGFTWDLTGEEPGAVRMARELVSSPERARLYVVESGWSGAGALADHRLALSPGRVDAAVVALARRLVVDHGLPVGDDVAQALLGAPPCPLREDEKHWVAVAASDVARAGPGALLAGGPALPAEAHALLGRLARGLGCLGVTTHAVTPFDDGTEGPVEPGPLAAHALQGDVDTLVILGGNPVFTASPGPGLAGALARVPHSFHLSPDVNETGAACRWTLPEAHVLESWGDAAAQDGTLSVVQPLVAPLLGGVTALEVVAWMGGDNRSPHALVRERWRAFLPPVGENDQAWRRVLHDGVLAGSGNPPGQVEPVPLDLRSWLRSVTREPGGLEVAFQPDPRVGDGVEANNAWLQELPDTFTRLTWGNAATLSPATARNLGLRSGDVARVSVGHPEVEIPVVVVPGHADGTVGVACGQGRRTGGRVATCAGVDAFPLRPPGQPWRATARRVLPAGRRATLATTEPDPEVTAGQRPVPTVGVRRGDHAVPDPGPSVVAQGRSPQWGMVVDLAACTGCGACVVACQAENNIPVVGRDSVVAGRAMHWLRVDRHHLPGGRVAFQPVACMHCERAPCEQVCPVSATAHSPDGLNDQAYSRCIGSRFCANNCPYRARRFNYFDYQRDFSSTRLLMEPFQWWWPGPPAVAKLRSNPNVTVRSRGVMEKCTYCVQRINEARVAARQAGRDHLRDGDVQVACQQACPTGAIRFGDLADPGSAVAQRAHGAHALLADQGTRPRTTYLPPTRDPHPDLEDG
jgi:molybdopterin-containing oxidoreductase family iron-sulfur binding subunit